MKVLRPGRLHVRWRCAPPCQPYASARVRGAAGNVAHESKRLVRFSSHEKQARASANRAAESTISLEARIRAWAWIWAWI